MLRLQLLVGYHMQHCTTLDSDDASVLQATAGEVSCEPVVILLRPAIGWMIVATGTGDSNTHQGPARIVGHVAWVLPQPVKIRRPDLSSVALGRQQFVNHLIQARVFCH